MFKKNKHQLKEEAYNFALSSHTRFINGERMTRYKHPVSRNLKQIREKISIQKKHTIKKHMVQYIWPHLITNFQRDNISNNNIKNWNFYPPTPSDNLQEHNS